MGASSKVERRVAFLKRSLQEASSLPGLSILPHPSPASSSTARGLYWWPIEKASLFFPLPCLHQLPSAHILTLSVFFLQVLPPLTWPVCNTGRGPCQSWRMGIGIFGVQIPVPALEKLKRTKAMYDWFPVARKAPADLQSHFQNVQEGNRNRVNSYLNEIPLDFQSFNIWEAWDLTPLKKRSSLWDSIEITSRKKWPLTMLVKNERDRFKVVRGILSLIGQEPQS